MTLATIINAVCDAVGIVRPLSVVNSTDQTVRALLQLAQTEGKALAARYDWPALQRDRTFTTVNAEVQTNAIPTDFSRFVNGTFWNRTRRRPVAGPVSPTEWQALKATSVPAVQDIFRVVGSDVLILPAPPAGDTMAFTYVRSTWCLSPPPASNPQTQWGSDDDEAVLPEHLHTLGIIWRFLASRGLEYAEAFRSYELEVAQEFARQGGRPVLNMAGAASGWRPQIGVPEGYWPL
jgi:hypothetical protein